MFMFISIVLTLVALFAIISPILTIVALHRTSKLADRISSLENKPKNQPGEKHEEIKKEAAEKAGEEPAVEEEQPRWADEPETPEDEPVVTTTPVSKLESEKTGREETRRSSPGDERISSGRVYSTFSEIDLENFAGKKLFAWLGGFALFLGFVFLLEYAYAEGYLYMPPELRVAGAFLLGLGLIFGGLYINTRKYRITAQTLAASAVAILYADAFAAHGFYHFIPAAVAFGLMALVTATALLLALRLDSIYVALLGFFGGFLTPFLLATGQDQPYFLFAYILLLDLGLIAVGLRKRWGFLISLAAAATFFTEWIWVINHFQPQKIYFAGGVFILFSYLFAASYRIGAYFDRQGATIFYPAVLKALLSLSFVAYLLGFSTPVSLYFFGGLINFSGLGAIPWIPLTILFLLDLAPAYLVCFEERAQNWHLLQGMLSFGLLLVWTSLYLDQSMLYWALSYYFAFGVLYGGLPVVLQRLRPETKQSRWGHLYLPLVLILMFFPVLTNISLSLGLWPFILGLALFSLLIAWLTAWSGVLVINLILIMGGCAFWVARMPTMVAGGLIEILSVITMFSVLFFAAGLFFSRLHKSVPDQNDDFFQWLERSTEHLPALATLFPFILLIMLIVNIELPSCLPIFGVTLLMLVLIHALIRYQKLEVLSLVSFAAVILVEYTWHGDEFQILYPWLSFGWYCIFYLFFLVFPFMFMEHLKEHKFPWIMAAFSGVLHFYLFYAVLTTTVGEAYIGLLPAILAGITILPLYYLVNKFPEENPIRSTVLACFGGVTLFFITLIFPLQFQKEWLTISWALEGVALLWLFRRINHEGLRLWGSGLLIVSFARLALNPTVFFYYSRSGTPIFNWYLYSFGLVAGCLFVAGWLVDRPPDSLARRYGKSWFPGLGAVLLFLLLNIEIADYFSEGIRIIFNFSASLTQDMTYSLTWALFALIVLVVGLIIESRAARLGSLGLFLLTIFKVFLHDLWQLGQLYRVASLIGLAVVLIFVSFLYQKYLSGELAKNET